MVVKKKSESSHPYFQSSLRVPEEFNMEELLVSRFDDWNLTEDEKKRLNLNLRKILHCHHYFNSVEFERISGNFIERLLNEKGQELHFCTQGGGVYLFMAVIKAQPRILEGKKIVCETSEVPLPIMKLPHINKLQVQFIYRPENISFFAAFPSLWAKPQIIQLFDPKSFKSKVA